MPSTESRFRRRVVWTASLLVLLLGYGLLCLSDLLLARWLDRQITLANAPARAIELRRAAQQDVAQLAASRSSGQHTMLFPALFEQEAFQAIARRYRVLPLGTQPLTSLAFCNEGTGLVTYVSDRFGFRNPDAAWDGPALDIALIGDSFVQGACVADQHTVAARLAAARHSVVSLGTSGNNGLMHAAVVRAFLPALRPRHAVMVFYANDNEDEEGSALVDLALPEATDYVARDGARLVPGPAYQRLMPVWTEGTTEAERQIARSGGSPGAPAGAGAPTNAQRWPKWLALSTLRAVALTAYKRWTGGALPWSSRLAIDTLAANCQPAQCQPLLVYIPNSSFWRPDPRADSYRQALRAHAAQYYPGMAWIDLSPLLAELGVAAYAPMGPHLSSAGYAVVAKAIDSAVQRAAER